MSPVSGFERLMRWRRFGYAPSPCQDSSRSAPGLHSCRRSFHQGKIAPEVLQTVRATEECGEIRRVHEHDVSSALLIWRHPEQAIELRVAGCGERVRTIEINGLAREQMHRFGVFGSQLIVRQMRMEIERRDVVEQSKLVNVPESRERRDLLRAFDQRGTEP